MVMLRVALMGLMLGGVAAVPRQLQAGGRPDKCNDDASFQAWLSLVNAACVLTPAAPFAFFCPPDGMWRYPLALLAATRGF